MWDAVSNNQKEKTFVQVMYEEYHKNMNIAFAFHHHGNHCYKQLLVSHSLCDCSQEVGVKLSVCECP